MHFKEQWSGLDDLKFSTTGELIYQTIGSTEKENPQN